MEAGTASRCHPWLSRFVLSGGAVSYTWAEAGPLGLRLQQGDGEVVIEAINDTKLMQTSALRPGLAFDTINGLFLGTKGKNEVVNVIKAAGRPLTIVFRGASLLA